MRRLIAISLILALALTGVTAAFAAWLLHTPGGFAWLAARATRMTDGALTLDQPAGTLAHGVTIAQLQYQAPTLSVRAHDLTLRMRPMSLLLLTPHIEYLNASKLFIRTVPNTEAPDQPLEVPALPIAIHVDAIRVSTVAIERGPEAIELEDVFVRYAVNAAQHEVHEAAMRVHGFAIEMAGRIATVAPYPLDGTVTVQRERGTPDVKVRVQASGDLKTLRIALAGVLAGAHIKASGDIEPGVEPALAHAAAQFEGFDARVVDEALPQTALSGEIKVTRANRHLVGDVAVQNALSGPYSDQRVPVSAVRASIMTDFTKVELKDLVATLHGGGTLAGAALLHAETSTMSLSARDIDLHALHQRLHATQLSGRLEAALTAERRSLTADLTQGEMRLRFNANLAHDTVTLHDATLYARGGEARARGSLSLSDTQPFSARVELRNFDPAAWGEFPAGSINGSLTSEGVAAGPSVKAQFEIAKSRLRNAPLAGGGKVALRGSRLSAADFTLRLGNNRVDVKGAFGAPKDTLQIRLDAPQLAIIHDAFHGQVKGEAQLAGGLENPTVRFDAQASALRAAGTSVQRATASGTLARKPAVPLRFHAHLTDVSYEGRKVRNLIAELTGPQSDHALSVKAQGRDYELEARARGAWSPEKRAWSGTLLHLSNRGALDVALETPLTLMAAPDRVTLGRSAIRVLDGRLELAELTYRPGHLSTSGAFSKLPAVRMANLLQSEPRVGGDLRLTGTWSLVQDGALTGSLAVKRDGGDITLGANAALPMQLQALSIQARLDRSRLEVQASLKSAAASAEGDGTLGVVPDSGVFPINSDSPLRASARVAVADLGAIARVLDANALVNGALQATLSLTGTFGGPIVNGTLQGERLAYALPPQGVDLRNGTLRAVVNGRTVRVESFSIRSGEGIFTARGNLGFNGAGATLDWQADRLLLLGRPDRRLVVSGKGRAGLVDGHLSLSGGVQVNNGYFEIGPDALPEPGPDVIITGEKPRVQEQSPLARTFLELVVSLGENLRVRGRGIDTRLAGEIVIATRPGQPLQAKGTVRTVRGVYTALGQRLEIERGELLFSGPVDKPGLDIRAMRKRQAVEAGVEVSGTLNAPRARIVSDPPVAENEAISWLVLGHGTGEASRGDLAMLPLAASSLLGTGGDSRTIAQRLGLDTLGLRGAGGENQFVTVGKRIADRLYVAFEQSLGAAQSILKLEFDLTNRVLLRAQTGEANAVGVFYRYTFD